MCRIRWISIIVCLCLIRPDLGFAQFAGGQGGGGQGGNQGGIGGGQGGQNQNNASGIKIDAEGVVTLATLTDGTGTLEKKRRELQAKTKLPPDVNRKAALRLVSLVQLEKQLEVLYTEKQPIPNELFFLAGLQSIKYVFVYPDESDLIIAGPAEGFVPDGVGRMIGIESARPALRLDDLIVALRTIVTNRQLGCSIDPVPKRLAELVEFIKRGEPATIGEVEARFNQMDDILGYQVVKIVGVPEDSHFATMLVEADYRMKRIAIGVESPAIKGLKSHLAMLGAGANVMQRWWFVPNYEGIYRNEDGLAFQFAGQRAQLLAEDEVADDLGNRSTAPTTRKSTHSFAKQFTDKFAQLADKSPTFAELQNLIDWSIFAALLEKEHIPERIGWKKELFMDEARLPHPKFETPKLIPSSVNYKRSGDQVIGLVGGGVIINPQSIVTAALATAANPELVEATRASVAPTTDSHRWWWDDPTSVTTTKTKKKK